MTFHPPKLFESGDLLGKEASESRKQTTKLVLPLHSSTLVLADSVFEKTLVLADSVFRKALVLADSVFLENYGSS